MTEQWTYADVAQHLGVTVQTLYAYKRDGRLPEPDGMLGQVPWWKPATIHKWQAQRPGRGRRAVR